jgi:hypothetical protein
VNGSSFIADGGNFTFSRVILFSLDVKTAQLIVQVPALMELTPATNCISARS